MNETHNIKEDYVEPVIKLELTINEVNAILGGLAELPFKASADLIQKIRAASISQLAPHPTVVADNSPHPTDEERN